MAMGETNGKPEALDPDPDPDADFDADADADLRSPILCKRKSDLGCDEEREPDRHHAKLIKFDAPISAAEENHGEEGVDCEEEAIVDCKGKGVAAAVDKGKGKMIAEEEEEDGDSGDDDEDDNDSSDDDIVVEDGEESDFEDDPLAEVDLENILPSRTRRRGPPPPGSYFVTEQDGDADDDDDDEDESE